MFYMGLCALVVFSKKRGKRWEKKEISIGDISKSAQGQFRKSQAQYAFEPKFSTLYQ